jgi:hypothetical protein
MSGDQQLTQAENFGLIATLHEFVKYNQKNGAEPTKSPHQVGSA